MIIFLNIDLNLRIFFIEKCIIDVLGINLIVLIEIIKI